MSRRAGSAVLETPEPDEDIQRVDPVALESAFQLFGRLSAELSQSYEALKARVDELNRQAELANRQRLKELSEKERIASRLESLLQLLPGGVVVLNQQGRVNDCNPAAVELLGEPLQGELWREVIADRFAPRQDDGHEVSLKNGRRISLATRSLTDEPGQIILLTDQTETRRLQHNLSRHERLSAMGKMVSSLAHQIRTPLSAAMLYAGHLAGGELDQDQVSRFSGKLVSRLVNMERQVKDMLIFARGDTLLDEEIPAGLLIEEARAAAEVLLRTGATCHWEDSADGLLLRCNREALTSALLNLIENALQAAGSGACLRISVRPGGCAGEEADHSGASPRWLCLSVEDNGPGIEEELLPQLTEAFFTTRAQGTGLGLAVAQIVARAHGGRFFIESEPRGEASRTDRYSTRAGFVLPCRPAPGAGRASGPRTGSAGRPCETAGIQNRQAQPGIEGSHYA